MSLLDKLLSLLAPHECLGCGKQGSLICDKCATELSKISERCYRCRRLSPGNLTCSKCHKLSKLTQVKVATIYSGIAKELVWKLKFSGARAAANSMAIIMSQQIESSRNMLIVPVPTATSRVRQRGYDQAVLLAKELARQTGMKYVSCLSRTSQAHQVGAGRSQRIKQLAGAFRVTKSDQISGAHILLIDDVITTGATLESAALILKKAGAKRVDALIFAQP